MGSLASPAQAGASRAEPVRLALVGTGRYAKSGYLPILKQLQEEVQVQYVWSRSEEGARGLQALDAEMLGASKIVHGDEQYNDVIQDDAVDAVILILPAHKLTSFALTALQAGKHVLSEKPISNDLPTASAAVQKYRSLGKGAPVWWVGENFRFDDAWHEAAALVPQLGKVLKLEASCDMTVPPSNQYYTSQWRRDPSLLPGGFITDMCVHHVAAIRQLAAAAGAGAPRRVMSATSFADAGMSAPDTLAGTVVWESGLLGSVSFCIVSAQPRFSFLVSGLNGTLEVTRAGWTGTRTSHTITYQLVGHDQPTTKSMGFSGFENEVKSFVDVVRRRKLGEGDADNKLGAPEEALKDLEFVLALLENKGELAV